MFLTDCPSCGRRELRSSRGFGMANTATGIEITYTCRGCSQHVTERLGAPTPAGPALATAAA